MAETKHLERAPVCGAETRRPDGRARALAHISPLGWAHILLTGEYRWPKRR